MIVLKLLLALVLVGISSLGEAAMGKTTSANCVGTADNHNTYRPMTVCAWVWANNDSGSHTWWAAINGDSTNRAEAVFEGADATDRVFTIECKAGGSCGTAIAGSFTPNTWIHHCATWASETSRSGHLNGGTLAGGTQGTSTTSVTQLDFTFGAVLFQRGGCGGTGIHLNGNLAEVGIWTRALTDDEKASLGKGFGPMCVRSGLKSYYRLLRDSIASGGNVRDRFGFQQDGGDITGTGFSHVEHPPQMKSYCQ